MISPFDNVGAASAGPIRPRAVLAVLAWYLIASGVGHTAWEIAHLPLYTLWTTASPARQALAIAHCTGGDLIIASWTLLLAVLVMRLWPGKSKTVGVGVTMVVLAVLYTGFSEWRNVYVAESWAYSALMPKIAIAGYAIGSRHCCNGSSCRRSRCGSRCRGAGAVVEPCDLGAKVLAQVAAGALRYDAPINGLANARSKSPGPGASRCSR